MTGRMGFALLLCATMARTALAQQAPDPSKLNDSEKLGQKLFYQSCGVCHTKPQITSAQFGPVLSKDAAGGDPAVIREVITNGTPRMPGFKFQFDAAQINALVSYVKILPVPPQQPPAGGAPR
jgi:mono/diheme cytochrome c family protein